MKLDEFNGYLDKIQESIEEAVGAGISLVMIHRSDELYARADAGDAYLNRVINISRGKKNRDTSSFNPLEHENMK